MKNSERIAYAKKQLEQHGIEYTLKNEATGFVSVLKKKKNTLTLLLKGYHRLEADTHVTERLDRQQPFSTRYFRRTELCTE